MTTTRSDPTWILIVGLVLSLVVCALLVMTIRRMIGLMVIAARGAPAEGLVVDRSVARGQQAGQRYAHGHVDFTTESGEGVRFREFRPLHHQVGAVVPVRYSRRNPQRATISPPGSYVQPMMAVSVCLVAFGIMLGVAIWQLFWV